MTISPDDSYCSRPRCCCVLFALGGRRILLDMWRSGSCTQSKLYVLWQLAHRYSWPQVLGQMTC